MPVSAWLPSTAPMAVIVGVHGFNDYRNAFALPGVFLAEHGIAVYAYDQRGFGATRFRGIWPGTNLLRSDLRRFVTALQERYPTVPVYLLGDSMGAAVVITAASQKGFPDVDGVILNAPAVWGGSTFSPLYRVGLWLVAHIAPWHEVTGEGLGVIVSDNREILQRLSEDPHMIRATRFDALYGLVHLMDDAINAVPQLNHTTLVLYGMRDEVIPKEPVCRLLETLRAPRRAAFYEEGYHLLLRDLQAERVWRDILVWLKDQSAELSVSNGGHCSQFPSPVGLS